MMGVFNHLIAHTLPLIPRPIVWRVARRYIAGIALDDAARVIEGLRRRGLRASLDILGENVSTREEALRARDSYLGALERIRQGDLPAGISVKLSQLGIKLDRGLARESLEELARSAATFGRFVRIDMEDSSTTDATLSIYREVSRFHRNVGVVLQAYLRRTLDDARNLLPIAPDIRLCKGIYVEPESIAFQGFEEIRSNYLAVLRLLISGGARVALATHDPVLLESGLRSACEADPEKKRHEVQMLYGVAERLWDRLVAEKNKLRIYVPFGTHWYPYSLRRLKENPQIAGHVFRGLFR